MSGKYQNILLDRDGTIIEECHYLANPDKIQLIPGTGSTLRTLTQAGKRLFLVTNQSGIGRGYFTQEQYFAVQKRLQELLMDKGVDITDTAMCPHAPGEGCVCRKPLPGLWDRLHVKHDIDPERTIMIGDKTADIRFARAAGLATAALVLTGHGRQTSADLGLPVSEVQAVQFVPPGNADHPDIVASNLAAMSELLLDT